MSKSFPSLMQASLCSAIRLKTVFSLLVA